MANRMVFYTSTCSSHQMKEQGWTSTHLVCHGGIEKVASLRVDDSLWLSSAARRVEDEESILTVQRLWRTDGRLARHCLGPERVRSEDTTLTGHKIKKGNDSYGHVYMHVPPPGGCLSR